MEPTPLHKSTTGGGNRVGLTTGGSIPNPSYPLRKASVLSETRRKGQKSMLGEAEE
jgi:hypothetical protein